MRFNARLLVSLCLLTLILALFKFPYPRDRLPQSDGQAQARTVPGTKSAVQPANPTAAKIVAAAKAQQGTLYDASYVKIAYPNGDVPRERGVCTDVIVRALRKVGYDLQRLMHEDMKRNFSIYPNKWGLRRPDPNIDHRRVPNQMKFFKRFGIELTRKVSADTLKQWQPGDFVYWDIGGPLHTGVLSNNVNSSGVPLVVHNLGGCREEDVLTTWKIIGHFRYPVQK